MSTMISQMFAYLTRKSPVILSSVLLISLLSCSTASKRSVIIQANDVGLAKSIDEASKKLLEESKISSLSLIVVAPGFKEMAEYAKANPQFDYGVRLTSTSSSNLAEMGRFRPVSDVKSVPSLVDENGLFHTTTAFLNRYNASELEKELQAQIDLAKDSGINVSHLSVGGGDLYHSMELVDLLLKLSLTNKIPIAIPNFDNFDQFGCFEATKSLIPEFKARLEKYNIKTLAQWDIQNYDVSTDLKGIYFVGLLKNLPEGVTLIELRPSLNENETLANYIRSDGSTDLQHRFQDFHVFSENEEVEKLLSSSDLRLIGWKDYQR